MADASDNDLSGSEREVIRKAKQMTAEASAETVRIQDELGALLHATEAELRRYRTAFARCLIGGNHIASYRRVNWPDYPLDGLTRNQQCELALRTLGATIAYDMWCCWSEIMQARDSLTETHPDAEHAPQARDVL